VSVLFRKVSFVKGDAPIALDLPWGMGENNQRKITKRGLGISPRGAALMVGPPSDEQSSGVGFFLLRDSNASGRF